MFKKNVYVYVRKINRSVKSIATFHLRKKKQQFLSSVATQKVSFLKCVSFSFQLFMFYNNASFIYIFCYLYPKIFMFYFISTKKCLKK